MASTVHCLYCFEALAARLERRDAMTLAEVQKSWAVYRRQQQSSASAADPKKLAPALRRVADTSSSQSSGSSASSSTASLAGRPPNANNDTPMTSLSSLESDNDDEDDAALALDDSPLFVTWNVLSPRHEPALRGCIGTFEPQPLEEGLSSYAVTSALHDTRFDPIALRELPSLEVAVTLLTDFEDAADDMDWELGTHGLRISFTYHGRRKGATYLPSVAPEQGWTKEETVVSLMRKAGWLGQKDRWREVPLKVVRYQGEKHEIPYAEYKKWRTWADDQASNGQQ